MIYFTELNLIGGVVFGTVTSQTFLDFCLACIFILLLKKKNNSSDLFKNFKKIGIEWAFVGYIFVIILGFILNSSPNAEIFESLKKFVWIINLYLLIYGFQQVEITPILLIKYFSLSFIIPNLYALLSYLRGWDLLTNRSSDRIIGLLSSATYHAHANAVIYVFFSSVVLFLYKRLSFKLKIIVLTTNFLFFLSILLTFTRGIWISLVLSSLIMGFIWNYKKAVIAFVGASVVFVGVFLIWPKFNERVMNSFNTKANQERIDLFNVNVQIWKEYPLLGIGYGENLRRNRDYWDRSEWNRPKKYITSHAHNQYLNVLSTTGVFGFLFFISFIFYFLRKNWLLLRQSKRRDQTNSLSFRQIILFSCFWAQVEFLIACFTDVTFEYAKIRMLILVVWALIIVIERKPEIINDPVHKLL